MKILAVKDPHFLLGFKAPRSRNPDTFEDEILGKVSQIERICHDRNIDVIVLTGDVLDKKETSKYSLEAIAKNGDVLKRLRDSTMRKLLVSVYGNHDLPYSSDSYKEQSVYWYYVKLGYITDISNKTWKLSKKVHLHGIGYKKSILDFQKTLKELSDSVDLNVKNLVVSHEHLLPNKDFSSEKYLGSKMSYNKILSTANNIDVFIAGHYHKGYPSYSKNGRWIVNGWNLTRLARSYYTLDGSHKPQVSVIDIDRKGKITVEDIYLKVKPFGDAIDLEGLERDLKDTLDISSFISVLSETIQSEKKSDSTVKVRLNRRQKSLLADIMEKVS